jgi:hypothetical protein
MLAVAKSRGTEAKTSKPQHQSHGAIKVSASPYKRQFKEHPASAFPGRRSLIYLSKEMVPHDGNSSSSGYQGQEL